MLEAEKGRIDCVAIVTPNHQHFPMAMQALNHGLHVICDKPMTLTVDEARQLRGRVRETGLVFCLTHNYTGYPMVKQARAMVRQGRLGEIRKVVVEYPQGWLASAIESSNKQASWRTDPKRAGVSCCMGDIGSHAENLAEYVTGLKIRELCADLHSFVPGRTLDDDGSVLLRFDNGARGVLMASQISVGEENALRIRVYGTQGALEWCQENPETLQYRRNDQPLTVYRRGWAGTLPEAERFCRIPAGHPEGFLEAFANIYSSFADAAAGHADADFPSVDDGLRGMAFIEAVVKSAADDQTKWLPVAEL